jgi:hypothetical protein
VEGKSSEENRQRGSDQKSHVLEDIVRLAASSPMNSEIGHITAKALACSFVAGSVDSLGRRDECQRGTHECARYKRMLAHVKNKSPEQLSPPAIRRRLPRIGLSM